MKDGIGDYIFRRHILPQIRNSKKYKNWQITVFASKPVCHLIRAYDKIYVDRIHRASATNLKFKDRFLTFINKYRGRYIKYKLYEKKYSRYDEVLILTERSQCNDSVIQNIQSPSKTASKGYSFVSGNDYNEKYISKKKEFYDNKVYTKLIEDIPNSFYPTTASNLANKFLGENNPIPKVLSLPFKKEDYLNTKKNIKDTFGIEKFICFVPFASSQIREWSINNFAEAADFIAKHSPLKIIILGAKNDRDKANIFNMKKNCINMTGKTKLAESMLIAAVSSFAICVDTSLMHCALLGGSDTICVSNGNTHIWSMEYPHLSPPQKISC